MRTRKNIDKLYLKKFEAAEMPPPADAWQNIASRLPEEKRRILPLPLWLKFSGAAALALLFLTVGSAILTPSQTPVMAGTPIEREDIHREIRFATTDFNQIMLQASMTLQGIMYERSIKSHTSAGSFSGLKAPAGTSNPASPTESTLAGTSGNFEGGTTPGTPAAIHKNENTSEFQPDPSSLVTLNPEDTPEHLHPKNQDTTAAALALSENINPNEEGNEIRGSEAEDNALAAQLAKELSTPEEKEAPESRISISTRMAPVFFDSPGTGNAIASQYESNQEGGEVSLSYGLNLAYQLTDKIRIRSGINKLDLSNSAEGVPMAAAVNSAAFGDRNKAFVLASPEEGEVRQQMGFIEVPIELEYRLVDKKLGLNLIAGGSSLFLNRNNVSINTGNRTTYLGEANNLKNTSFSANLGLGLDYELAPKFHLNLEPIFKYQLESFNNNPEWKPYYFGVYSGFSISF